MNPQHASPETTLINIIRQTKGEGRTGPGTYPFVNNRNVCTSIHFPCVCSVENALSMEHLRIPFENYLETIIEKIRSANSTFCKVFNFEAMGSSDYGYTGKLYLLFQ